MSRGGGGVLLYWCIGVLVCMCCFVWGGWGEREGKEVQDLYETQHPLFPFIQQQHTSNTQATYKTLPTPAFSFVLTYIIVQAINCDITGLHQVGCEQGVGVGGLGCIHVSLHLNLHVVWVGEGCGRGVVRNV